MLILKPNKRNDSRKRLENISHISYHEIDQICIEEELKFLSLGSFVFGFLFKRSSLTIPFPQVSRLYDTIVVNIRSI